MSATGHERFDAHVASLYQQQTDLLRFKARRALLELVNDNLLHREDANEALADWGLPCLPGLWQVDVQLHAARVGYHPDARHAIDAATARLDREYAELFGTDTVCRVTAREAAISDRADPAAYGYQVTADVYCRIPVKATTVTYALKAAREHAATLLAGQDTHSGDTLTGACIDADLDVATAPLDPDTDAPWPDRLTCHPPDGTSAATWLGWEHAALTRLREQLRRWILESVDDATLYPGLPVYNRAAAYHTAAALLAELDLPPLPAARHYRVEAHWEATITGDTVTDATAEARQIWADASPSNRSRLLPVTCMDPPQQPRLAPVGDHRWIAHLQRTFRVCLRPDGHPATAQAVVHAHLQHVAGAADAQYAVTDLGRDVDHLLGEGD